ncbi:helix-turn-helix transcriptional regulator [Lampropedia puyangensis]|uniref:Helix-turn-helix transcriptional regulator n=1 Tax=Lampropedia puyangensis TaxID=1330072 RepID=A0A4S8F9V1_9BURK|nr:AraC family transcriptional regulator [Lampropedia puyangensis]THU04009.1 helix-turn-helix transcriptional regulator [Lampropedia puyangensis]
MPIYTCGQLTAEAKSLGGQVVFDHDCQPDMPVLSGTQRVQVLDNGLVLYLSQSQDLVSGNSSNILQSGIMAAVLLQGQAEVSLGQDRMHFQAKQQQQRAFVVNLTEADQFLRHWHAGRRETKLCLSFTSSWMERFVHDDQQCNHRLRSFTKQHWQRKLWQPSPNLLRRAHLLEQGIAHTPTLVDRLHYEGFALDMAAEILQDVDHSQPANRVSERCARHANRLKDWLDSGTAEHLRICDMARELGTNAVDLQNGFRTRFGMTIAAYVRHTRLERAYQALEQQAVSIESAAELAGYAHLSSFCAAFKQRYGFSPMQAKARA